MLPSVQTAEIAIKFGAAQIKNIILAAPENKTASNIPVKLDGVEQAIESSKQEGDAITINLKFTSEIKTGSTLRISFNLDEYTLILGIKLN